MDLNEELREKAEAGDADARYQLGINYLELPGMDKRMSGPDFSKKRSCI